MRAIDALFKTQRNGPAKLEVVGNAKYSSLPRFETQRRVVVTFFYEFGTAHAVEKWEFKNFGFDTHSPIKIHRA